MKLRFLFLFLSSLSFVYTNAQIITDRPDQTESSSTVPHGALQLESGILVGSEGNGNFSTQQFLLPTNLFRYGINNTFELRILSQFERIQIGNQSVQGISDLEVGTKIQFLKNADTNAEIALLSHLVLPSGSKELTGDEYGTINKLCISHTLSENVGLGYNVGYNYFGSGNGDATYSIALAIGVNDKVGVYIEPYGELANFDEHVSNIDAGFTYLANNNLQYDFSFGTGISHRMNYISIGFSWLMERSNEN